MKIFIWITVLFAAVIAITSCQKDLSYESGLSIGSLKSSITGDCLPSTLNGNYEVDSILTSNNYIDVQVNVTVDGTFNIGSDTLNGYSFSKIGYVGLGLNTIRLYSSGKPIAAGINTFTIKYDSSICTFSVRVSGATIPAVYNLGGSPGSCTGFILAGTYTAGTALTSANTVSLAVNVTSIGSYSISTTSVNGIVFSASGVFTSTGSHNIILTGSGIPLTGGTFSVTVNGSSSNCTFSVNFAGASFSLGGAGANCTGFILAGNYFSGIPLTAANTATINVNVTTVGGYSISSTTVNGIKFIATGTFATLGSQSVVLTGSGTPTVANTSVFSVTEGGSTCSFSLTATTPPAAVYTMDCTSITANGTYTVGTALASSNTIVLSVNVTSIGTYNITSLPAVNGISFSTSGIFTATGIQSVTLSGTGIPAAAGAFSYTITGGSNSCSVSITATAAAPGIFTCTIDGVPTTFNVTATATLTYTNGTDLYIYGKQGTTVEDMDIDITRYLGGNISAGTYLNTVAASTAGGYIISSLYLDIAGFTHWGPASIFTNPDPFTIIITSITATRVQGTFTGTIRDLLQGGTHTKSVTAGVFDVPIQ